MSEDGRGGRGRGRGVEVVAHLVNVETRERHPICLGSCSIGREQETNDVVLPGKVVSKEHAVIETRLRSAANTGPTEQGGGKYEAVIADKNSRNGTFVGHMHLKEQETELKHQDLLRFGMGTDTWRFEFVDMAHKLSPRKEGGEGGADDERGGPMDFRDTRSRPIRRPPPIDKHEQKRREREQERERQRETERQLMEDDAMQQQPRLQGGGGDGRGRRGRRGAGDRDDDDGMEVMAVPPDLEDDDNNDDDEDDDDDMYGDEGDGDGIGGSRRRGPYDARAPPRKNPRRQPGELARFRQQRTREMREANKRHNEQHSSITSSGGGVAGRRSGDNGVQVSISYPSAHGVATSPVSVTVGAPDQSGGSEREDMVAEQRRHDGLMAHQEADEADEVLVSTDNQREIVASGPYRESTQTVPRQAHTRSGTYGSASSAASSTQGRTRTTTATRGRPVPLSTMYAADVSPRAGERVATSLDEGLAWQQQAGDEDMPPMDMQNGHSRRRMRGPASSRQHQQPQQPQSRDRFRATTAGAPMQGRGGGRRGWSQDDADADAAGAMYADDQYGPENGAGMDEEDMEALEDDYHGGASSRWGSRPGASGGGRGGGGGGSNRQGRLGGEHELPSPPGLEGSLPALPDGVVEYSLNEEERAVVDERRGKVSQLMRVLNQVLAGVTTFDSGMQSFDDLARGLASGARSAGAAESPARRSPSSPRKSPRAQSPRSPRSPRGGGLGDAASERKRKETADRVRVIERMMGRVNANNEQRAKLFTAWTKWKLCAAELQGAILESQHRAAITDSDAALHELESEKALHAESRRQLGISEAKLQRAVHHLKALVLSTEQHAARTIVFQRRTNEELCLRVMELERRLEAAHSQMANSAELEQDQTPATMRRFLQDKEKELQSTRLQMLEYQARMARLRDALVRQDWHRVRAPGAPAPSSGPGAPAGAGGGGGGVFGGNLTNGHQGPPLGGAEATLQQAQQAQQVHLTPDGVLPQIVNGGPESERAPVEQVLGLGPSAPDYAPSAVSSSSSAPGSPVMGAGGGGGKGGLDPRRRKALKVLVGELQRLRQFESRVMIEAQRGAQANKAAAAMEAKCHHLRRELLALQEEGGVARTLMFRELFHEMLSELGWYHSYARALEDVLSHRFGVDFESTEYVPQPQQQSGQDSPPKVEEVPTDPPEYLKVAQDMRQGAILKSQARQQASDARVG